MRRELEWRQKVNSRGKVRPGFSVNCELTRVGQQDRVTGWQAQEEGGRSPVGRGITELPGSPAPHPSINDPERAAASVGKAVGPSA